MQQTISKSSVADVLSGAGYEPCPGKEKYPNEIRIYVDVPCRRTFMKETIAPLVGGEWMLAKASKSTGLVRVGEVTVVARPTYSKSNVRSMHTNMFLGMGEDATHTFRGASVAVKKFTNAQTMQKSILDGLRAIPETVEFSKAFEQYFRRDTFGSFAWPNVQPKELRSSLGIYLGEMLFGYEALRRNFAKCVSFPIDPQFRLVDTFVDKQAVSVKFGGGAAASLFSSLMQSAYENVDKMPDCEFQRFVRHCKNYALNPLEGRSCMWYWGTHILLGLDLLNPLLAYEQLLAGKDGSESRAILRAAKDHPEHSVRSAKAGRLGISAFFNDAFAARMNNDQESLKQINKLLLLQNYWQATLRQKEWYAGTVIYDVIRAGKESVRIIGNKSPAHQLSCETRWIAYKIFQQNS